MAGDPIGTVRVRADGTPWQKTEHGEDWKDLSGGKLGAASKSPQGGPGDETSGANSGWKELQRSFGLDGHLPHETVHSSHVQIDTDGNTDTKPVLTWQDAVGNQRHSYTMEFHRERARALRGEVAAHSDRLEAAYEILRGDVDEHCGTARGDAAAAAMIHLHSGHKVGHVLSLSTSHAAVAPQDDDVDVEKSLSAGTPHPHRVHLIMPHVHGHVYPTSMVCREVAAHVGKKLKQRAFAKSQEAGDPQPTKLFGASEANVEAALANAGAGGIPQHVVRHHAITRASADLLSKMGPVNLADPQGLEQVRLNIKQVSDEIAARYGHHPAPEDMAYIPPSVAMAYVEECGGHHLWPKVFPLEKSQCTSATPAGVSSIEVSKSRLETLSTGSPSTPPTSAPPPRTPSPSPTRSVMQLRGRPWHQVADEIEVHLAKAGDPIRYDKRFPPLADEMSPRYFGPGTAHQDYEVVDGVRLKAEAAGKAIYLTFMGETEEAMQVIAHGDEVRKFTIAVADFRDLTEAEYTARYEMLLKLNRKYDESVYGVRPKAEKTVNITPGPKVGDSTGIVVGPPPSPNRTEYPFVGVIEFQGLTIDVENLKGDVREGVDGSGKAWRSEMRAHYGEIRGGRGKPGVKGMDGDHLDVYVGDDPTSEIVVVIDQRVPSTGEVDEQKLMIGFTTVDEAIATYRRQYDDPGFFGGCVVMTVARLKEKLKSRAQAGVPLEKSLTSMGDLFNDIVGINSKPAPSKTKLAFQKAVAKVLMAIRKVKLGKTGADEELMRCHEEFEKARDAMCVDVDKGQPGPAGVAAGTTSVHADGETWEKRSDGWHDLGMQDAGDAKKNEQTHEHSVSYDQTQATLIRLREKLKVVTDPKQKAVLNQQIHLLRKRLAGYQHAELIGKNDNNESKADEMAKSQQDMEWAFTKEFFLFVEKSQADSAQGVLVELAESDNALAKHQAKTVCARDPDGFVDLVKSLKGIA